jgi:hypothetical protein
MGETRGGIDVRTCDVCKKTQATEMKCLNTISVAWPWRAISEKVYVCDECMAHVPELGRALIAGMRLYQPEATT